MKILAIETSCDETALAVIEGSGDPRTGEVRFTVLSNVILSQVKLHAKYGGVYPSLAKREHAKNITPLLRQVLHEAHMLETPLESQLSSENVDGPLTRLVERYPDMGTELGFFLNQIKKPKIDAVAVTHGPGLEPALWVGINFAKALSLVWNIPIIPVNHMEGHIVSALLKRSQNNAEQTPVVEQSSLRGTAQKGAEKIKPITYNLKPITFPMLALLISGGHTELVLSEDWLQYKIVGETRDDAIGEAFDKVARMLGLPYPGGPYVAKEAENFEGEKTLKLPRPMIDTDNFDFSFSGIKTAVLYELKKRGPQDKKLVQEFSHEFEEAVTEVVVKKTINAALQYGAKTIVVGGGVSANKRIREALVEETRNKLQDTNLFIPPQELTTDNALMIAVAGYIRHNLQPTTHNLQHIKAVGTLRLS